LSQHIKLSYICSTYAGTQTNTYLYLYRGCGIVVNRDGTKRHYTLGDIQTLSPHIIHLTAVTRTATSSPLCVYVCVCVCVCVCVRAKERENEELSAGSFKECYQMGRMAS